MSSRPPAATCRTFVAIVLLPVVAGCGHGAVHRLPDGQAGTTVAAHEAQARRRSRGEEAVIHAVSQVGVPYRYGGSSTKGFDCSGLVQFAWSRAGRAIPRTTTAQYRNLTPVGRNELRSGDLVFFNIDGKVAHVGLYVGDERFVHAPSSGREVTIERLDGAFYRRAFVRGARP